MANRGVSSSVTLQVLVLWNWDSSCKSENFHLNSQASNEPRESPQVAQARNMSIDKDLYGKKTYRFCNLRKWKDFNKKQLTLLKMCVTSLLCGPRADLWPFT